MSVSWYYSVGAQPTLVSTIGDQAGLERGDGLTEGLVGKDVEELKENFLVLLVEVDACIGWDPVPLMQSVWDQIGTLPPNLDH